MVDELAADVAAECLAEARALAEHTREEREFAAVVASTERFVLRAMLQKLVQTVATRGEPLVLRTGTRLVLERNMVQSLVGRVAQLEAPGECGIASRALADDEEDDDDDDDDDDDALD